MEFFWIFTLQQHEKDDLVLLGWSLQSPLHVGNNHDEEEDEIWSLIHYVRTRTLPYRRGLYAKYTNKIHTI